MWTEILKFISAAAVGAAMGTLGSILVFQINRADRRYNIYDELRKNFDEDPQFSRLFASLDQIDGGSSEGKVKLEAIDASIRHGFMAMLERMALVWRSGLVDIRLLNYNFGYYAVLAYDTDEMWPNGKDDREDAYYGSLRGFVSKFRSEQTKLKADSDAYVKYIKIGGIREILRSPFA